MPNSRDIQKQLIGTGVWASATTGLQILILWVGTQLFSTATVQAIISLVILLQISNMISLITLIYINNKAK